MQKHACRVCTRLEGQGGGDLQVHDNSTVQHGMQVWVFLPAGSLPPLPG